jgi:hypothetical protein
MYDAKFLALFVCAAMLSISCGSDVDNAADSQDSGHDAAASTETDAGSAEDTDVEEIECPSDTMLVDGVCTTAGLSFIFGFDNGSPFALLSFTVDPTQTPATINEIAITQTCTFVELVAEAGPKATPDCFDAGELVIADGTNTYVSSAADYCPGSSLNAQLSGTLDIAFAGGRDIGPVDLQVDVPAQPNIDTETTADGGFRSRRDGTQWPAVYLLEGANRDTGEAVMISCRETSEGELLLSSDDVQAIADFADFSDASMFVGNSGMAASGERFVGFFIQHYADVPGFPGTE